MGFLWAHMGPNPDRAPTRTGLQPGLGPNPDWAPTRLGLHRATGVPRKLRIFGIFQIFFCIFGIFCQILLFLVKIMWFLSFSSKNDAELFINFVKIQFLDPKRAKLVQKSYGKFTESLQNLQDLSRRTHKGPYGPIYGPIRPICAHMGPNADRAPTRTGPQPGPGHYKRVWYKHNVGNGTNLDFFL